jgi:hypothetical protein
MASPEPQSTNSVLMIRPVRFQGNLETRESNRFQSRDAAITQEQAQRAALAEFEALAVKLRAADVVVHILDDTLEPLTPDSIFPNNWVSFHADGTVVLYPMMALNRRLERREDVLEKLSQEGLLIRRVIDLTHHEREEKFLEGTGSLVLDRAHRIAFACISPRTDLDVLGDFAQQLDYEIVAFEAADAAGVAIYHTNVLMCVGTRFAAVCSAAIREDARASVLGALRNSGHAVLELSFEQMNAFAGNMLELHNVRGEPLVAMSARAFESLSDEQREFIHEHAGPIVSAAIPTIETLGGGSVRCMLAEMALPRKQR